MNHSKSGLNAPFYQWLDDVRRAMRKEKELQEKLKFYEAKLVGYKSVVYDRIGPPGTSGSEKDLFYWMDKLEHANRDLVKVKKAISEYQVFLESQGPLEQEVLSQLVLHHRSVGSISVSRIKTNGLIGIVARAWLSNIK